MSKTTKKATDKKVTEEVTEEMAEQVTEKKSVDLDADMSMPETQDKEALYYAKIAEKAKRKKAPLLSTSGKMLIAQKETVKRLRERGIIKDEEDAMYGDARFSKKYANLGFRPVIEDGEWVKSVPGGDPLWARDKSYSKEANDFKVAHAKRMLQGVVNEMKNSPVSSGVEIVDKNVRMDKNTGEYNVESQDVYK